MNEDDVVIDAEDRENRVRQAGSESDIAESEDRAEHKLAKMKAELEVCRKEKQEYLDGWQRAKADYVNALRRFEEDTAGAIARGAVAATRALLPALDSLDRAKEHGDVPEGFSGIAHQIEDGFAKLGLTAIGTIGEPFNPSFHEALGQDVTESAETDDTVSAVLEKGWKIGPSGGLETNDIVIRPAKVRVAHFEKE